MNAVFLKSRTRGLNFRWHDVELLKIGNDEVVRYSINFGHRVKQLPLINDAALFKSGTKGTNFRWHNVELLKIGNNEVVR